MGTLREQIQQNATSAIIFNNFEGILDIAPRVGKSKITIDALRKFKGKILITVPYNVIMESWEKEFAKWELDTSNITICNQRYIPEGDFDLVICDEVHSLSDNQIIKLKGKKILGLSGSISKETKLKLKEELGITNIFSYSIEQAIKDNIISNFEITVVMSNLSRTRKVNIKTKTTEYVQTEFARYESLTKVFNKLAYLSRDMRLSPKERAGHAKGKMFAAMRRANFLYSCPSKIDIVKEIIDEHERALIFTTRTKVADELADSYHSKSPKENLNKFINGDIKKLAVAQMVQMGVTIPNLKIGIFHQIQSNDESAVQKVLRMCNLEDDKIAKIFICCYANTVDQNWVMSSLNLIPSSKIKYIYR